MFSLLQRLPHESAAALQKTSPSTWLFLAMAHQKVGRTDKAQ
jgi:hypothetical protein